MSLSDNEIEIIRGYLTHQPVLRAYVFGSYARNQATPDSDVDLLVELDYSQHVGLGFLGIKYDLEEKLKKKIDLISLNGISKYIKPSIMKDKVLIYEKVSKYIQERSDTGPLRKSPESTDRADCSTGILPVRPAWGA